LVSFSAPAKAFPSDTVVTISTLSVTDSRIGCGLQGSLCGGDPSLIFEIATNPSLQPTLPLYFTVNYNNGQPNVPNPLQAVLLRFDPTGCKCVPELGPGSPSNSSLTAEINALGIFQVGLIQAATTMDGIRVYPNPYYTARDSWLTIDQIPAGSRVRIFTLRGELVFDSSADSNGVFTWQGVNRSGRAVASGVYLAVIEGNSIKTIQKVAVIR
jgi:hypothetical protein